MKLIVILAILSGLLLALLLWLRPIIGEMGTPTAPEVRGRASHPVPDGTTGLVAVPSGSVAVTGPPKPPPSAAEAEQQGVTHDDEIERLILAAVNAERAKAGQKPLASEQKLQEAARGHSDDMLVRGFFAHDDPDGLSAADRIEKQHRRMIGLTGENIWMGVNVNPADRQKLADQIMQSWLSSRGHRENILKPDYTHLGVGVAIKGKEVRATQDFGAIRALTDQDVPLQVRSGATLDLSTTPVSGPKPERYDLFVSDRGLAPGGARALSDGLVQAPAGIYKLRFYFPQAGGYNIYWGPLLEVR